MKDAMLFNLETLRAELLSIVNENVDQFIERLEHGTDSVEITYPLHASPAIFKGTKPTAIIFGDERVAARTWVEVYTKILRHCDADGETHETFMQLRNRVAGRSRAILSDQPDAMDKPVKVADGLYAEAYYDTESLIRVLTTRILSAARYDYSSISLELAPRR